MAYNVAADLRSYETQMKFASVVILQIRMMCEALRSTAEFRHIALALRSYEENFIFQKNLQKA